jgi:hypothetical protein
MSAHVRDAIAAKPAVAHAVFFASIVWMLGLVGLLLAGCAVGPPLSLLVGPDPSDPAVPVARTGYRSTTSGYVSQRPVSPAPWRPQNERVTPPTKSNP